MSASSQLRDDVRDKYVAAATSASSGACCGPTDPSVIGPIVYADIGPDAAPESALLASLGCGNPTAVADLREGETVLDLGSGGGLDVVLSARRVGPTGFAYGVDALEEMLELSRDNARQAGVTNVEFLEGLLEEVPLPDESIDAVISNCVINLADDKSAVIAEIFRLLRPGGRIGVADVIAEDHLTSQDRAARGTYADCVAGALSIGEYRQMLTEAGLVDIDIRLTREVADSMHSAIIKATKP